MEGSVSILTFGFSTPKKQTLLSRVIRLVENTKYSHTYLSYYDEQFQGSIVYHAALMNVHITPCSAFDKHNSIIEYYPILVPEGKKVEVLKLCGEYLDRPYGHLQIVGMGIARLLYLWFGVKTKNILADGPKTFVCSELMGRILLILGFDVDLKLLEYEGVKYINAVLKRGSTIAQ
jgi:hypothetical protein